MTAPVLSLCNEVVAKRPDGSARPFAEQCALAAELGYQWLEVAPYTLGADPLALSAAERAEMRRAAAAAGIAVTGLHWLLLTPEGLSITSDDADVIARTRAVMTGLVALCADLGGSVLVHGSPRQRAMPEERAAARLARAGAIELLASAGAAAQAAGVTYCIEPLSRRETSFINTVAEAAVLVREAGEAGLRTMIDTSAAGLTEEEPVAALIRRWWPSGLIAHVQLNDTNRRGPGQGGDDFPAVARALRAVGYDRVLAVEPFDYHPDGDTTAAVASGYWRGVWEAVADG